MNTFTHYLTGVVVGFIILGPYGAALGPFSVWVKRHQMQKAGESLNNWFVPVPNPWKA
jgi:hypothetical protein